jgi:hypothetical protein
MGKEHEFNAVVIKERLDYINTLPPVCTPTELKLISEELLKTDSSLSDE